MANFDKHATGTFCWPELCTSNWKEGKAFYTQLFDWGADDQPIGEDIFYTMLQHQGADIGAMYQMEQAQLDENHPSHWLNYIAVDDVDRYAAKVSELGGEVVAGPHDVMDAGRMAIIIEPGGARFALWQGNQHPGAGKLKEPGTMLWNELVTRDTNKSREFYSALFGWQAVVQDMDGMAYTLFSLTGSEEPIAGMLEMTQEWGEDIPSHWMTYFAVENCDNSIAKAKKLGAEICVPATDIPEVGRFSVLTDPQGAVFSIIQSA